MPDILVAKLIYFLSLNAFQQILEGGATRLGDEIVIGFVKLKNLKEGQEDVRVAHA
jgi:hypothetical protein